MKMVATAVTKVRDSTMPWRVWCWEYWACCNGEAAIALFQRGCVARSGNSALTPRKSSRGGGTQNNQ